jgi:DNA polymerase-3 subunit delta'
MVTAWHDIVGHEQNIKMLSRMLTTGEIQHAMLFVGPPGVGKFSAAHIFATGVLCSESRRESPCGACPSCQAMARGAHPDYIMIRPEGQNIKIDQIRSMQHEMALGPCLSEKRICIIENAETMTDQAANSLLKLLEEPPAYLVFVLTANQRHQLLDTIVSRCRLYSFQPVAAERIVTVLQQRGILPQIAVAAARLSGGKMGLALRLAEPDGFAARDQAVSILDRLTQGGIQEIWDMAAHLHEQENQAVSELLRYLECLVRDLLVLKTGQGEELVLNADLTRQLAAAAALWSEEALAAVYDQVRQAERAIAGNANTRLTSEALFIRLTDLYKGGGPIANSGWRTV